MRLHLLDLGTLDVDKGRILTPGSDEGVRVQIPVPGYLIEMDSGQHILIDTGLHPKHIADPHATYGNTPYAEELHVLMTEDDLPVARLAGLGLRPEDIDILVSTHFHFDHAGNHADFGRSRIVVQREAYAFNMEERDPQTHDLWDLPHLRYEQIEGDVEFVPGVELIQTNGHTPGHMSVVVRLPETGTVVLAIDAIATFENLETGNWGTAEDPVAAQASAERLVAIRDRESGLLITGHDPEQWAAYGPNTTFS